MRQIFRILPVLLIGAAAAVLWADSRGNGTGTPRDLSPIASLARVESHDLPVGDELLAVCQERLLAHSSVTAQVRQRVQLFDRQLYGSGIYLQQGGAGRPQFRFELNFQLEKRRRATLRNSDGVNLWLYDSDGDALRKVDLERLSLAVERHEMEAGVPAGQVLASRGKTAHGGIPRLLADLDRNFQFHTVGQADIAGVEVLVVQGVWKPERLRQLVQQGEEDFDADASTPVEVDVTKLGPHVPYDVLLYLGKEDLFPYRVQYRRLEAAKKGETPQTKTLVEMELFQVRFDAPVAPSQFAKPVDIVAEDHTDTFAKRLVRGDLE